MLTPDHVPVWDYRAPQQPYDIKDASAGAIMACGLLDLHAATAGATGTWRCGSSPRSRRRA
ncbi:hypothetical protein ACFQ3Z_05300 [Streptomyces nogalater]